MDRKGYHPVPRTARAAPTARTRDGIAISTTGTSTTGTSRDGPDDGPACAIGIDVGATLAKVARRSGDGPADYALFPAPALDDVARSVHEAGAERIGLTGGGASELAERLGQKVRLVNEFAAWGAGSTALLDPARAPAGASRQLVVSVGTGTSVLQVDGLAVSRIGGTALGGGTVMGLGRLLTGATDFASITALAARGSRASVDLLVSDIYRTGESPLAGEITASCFGRLARGGAPPEPEDLAMALMTLVGENVGLISTGLAAAAQTSRILFGGATLRENPALEQVIGRVVRALGREPHFLAQGEYAGALGALLLSEAA